MGMYAASFVGLLIISVCVTIIDAVPAYFVFGDSLVDAGNNNYLATQARADSYPYGIDFPTHQATGRFSNGYNMADIVSMKMGGRPVLPYLSPSLTGNELLRGANFASAGVGILNDTGFQFVNILRVPQQLAYFEEYQNRVAKLIGRNATQRLVAEGLVSVTLGGNDYVNNYYLLPVTVRALEYSLPNYTTYIVSEFAKYLKRLYELGARRIMVMSTGQIGCAPAERAQRSRNGECAPDLQKAGSLFNSMVKSLVGQLNSELSAQVYTFADRSLIKGDIFTNAQAFGFKVLDQACCGQGRNNGVGLCTAVSNLCSNRDEYLFWDSYHPGQRANEIIVSEFFNGNSTVMSPINLSQMLQLQS